MAFPRPEVANGPSVVDVLGQVARDEGVSVVVVGRPRALSGRVTQSTAHADALFAALVAALPQIKVVQWDERLTTHEAGRRMSLAGVNAREQRGRLDSAAAVVLLQSYLDAHRVG